MRAMAIQEYGGPEVLQLLDVAGVVKAVGPAVTEFSPGDEVPP